MSTSLPVNAHLIATQIAASGLSDNQLASAGGIGKMWLRHLRKGMVHKNTSLADMQYVLAALDMTWGEMLDGAPTEPIELDAVPDPDRVQLLSELLIDYTGAALHHDQLCIVLGTTVDQLRADVEQVKDRLSAFGIGVEFTTSGIIHVRRSRNAALERARDELNSLIDAEKGTKLSALQLLHRAAFGGLSNKSMTNNQRVQVGLLTNRRLIETAGPYKLAATPDVMLRFTPNRGGFLMPLLG